MNPFVRLAAALLLSAALAGCGQPLVTAPTALPATATPTPAPTAPPTPPAEAARGSGHCIDVWSAPEGQPGARTMGCTDPNFVWAIGRTPDSAWVLIEGSYLEGQVWFRSAEYAIDAPHLSGLHPIGAAAVRQQLAPPAAQQGAPAQQQAPAEEYAPSTLELLPPADEAAPAPPAPAPEPPTAQPAVGADPRPMPVMAVVPTTPPCDMRDVGSSLVPCNGIRP